MSTPKRPSSSPTGPAAGGQPQRPPQSPLVRWIWWVGMALLLAWNLYAFLLPKTAPAATLSYTAFLEQVRADNVASVTLAGQSAERVFKNAIAQPAEAAGSQPRGRPDGSAQATAPLRRPTPLSRP